MKHRRVAQHPGRHKAWACPCGAKLGLEVTRTEHDEDGFILRVRVCKNCGEPMATEERPIPYSSFFPRANSLLVRAQKIYHATVRVCRHCKRPYRGGEYNHHVATAPHLAALSTKPTNQSRQLERARRKKAYWRDRGFTHLEEAS